MPLVITDDATAEELREAVLFLNAKKHRVFDAEVKASIQAAIDEALDMMLLRAEV